MKIRSWPNRIPGDFAAQTRSLARWVATQSPIALVLLVAITLRAWNITQNGYGRDYYAAGVRSMMGDWHNFVFNSFDPSGFVSLDKPPIAIWLQVLSVKVIGFGPVAVLLPQIVEGILAVLLVYAMVRRTFGSTAGLVSALLLALTPISVAVDRSNNTDSCLVVVLLASAWAAMRAAESGRLGYLCLSMGLVGLGFNVKMGAALAIAPALAATYLAFASDVPIGRRLAHVVMASIVMIAVSLPWVAMYDLTPTGNRPFVGSTTGNSMLQLTFEHNGLSRFIPRARQVDTAPAAIDAASDATQTAPRPRALRGFDRTPAGWLRLFRPALASQVAWWLPLALSGIFMAWRSSDGSAQTRGRRIAVAVWSGWLAIYWIVFSFAGGTFLPYYLAALGPALAALAGIGAAELWRLRATDGLRAMTLPALVCATALWQAYLVMGQIDFDTRSWASWMLVAIVATALVAAFPRISRPAYLRNKPRLAFGLAFVSCAALIFIPFVSALSVVLVRPNVSVPSANLAVFVRAQGGSRQRTGYGEIRGIEKLQTFLQSERRGEHFLAAASSSRIAAPLIIATGEPVIAMGGFAGRDPILKPIDLQRMVEGRQLRFVVLDRLEQPAGGRAPQRLTPDQIAIVEWVRAHGTKVERSLWSASPEESADAPRANGGRRGRQTIELFDLRSQSQS